MLNNMKNIINMLKYLHWFGVLLLICGISVYLFTAMSLEVSGMLLIASLIGIGLVMMSPYPVALFIQWAKKQDEGSGPKSPGL